VRGSEGLDRPVIILAPRDQCADTNDRMATAELAHVIAELRADGVTSLIRYRKGSERAPGPDARGRHHWYRMPVSRLGKRLAG
jgi:hypothetical protein